MNGNDSNVWRKIGNYWLDTMQILFLRASFAVQKMIHSVGKTIKKVSLYNICERSELRLSIKTRILTTSQFECTR